MLKGVIEVWMKVTDLLDRVDKTPLTFSALVESWKAGVRNLTEDESESRSVASGMSSNERMSKFVPSLLPGSSLPWVSVTLIVTFLIYISPASTYLTVDRESELQKIFQIRNEDDWKSAWHMEKHSRCRDQLVNHMEWACGKDVYRLNKRSKVITEPIDSPFLASYTANNIIKPWVGYVRRKRESKSITDECCSVSGCTWEEYAEYCPAHRRYRVSRSQS